MESGKYFDEFLMRAWTPDKSIKPLTLKSFPGPSPRLYQGPRGGVYLTGLERARNRLSPKESAVVIQRFVLKNSE